MYFGWRWGRSSVARRSKFCVHRWVAEKCRCQFTPSVIVSAVLRYVFWQPPSSNLTQSPTWPFFLRVNRGPMFDLHGYRSQCWWKTNHWYCNSLTILSKFNIQVHNALTQWNKEHVREAGSTDRSTKRWTGTHQPPENLRPPPISSCRSS